MLKGADMGKLVEYAKEVQRECDQTPMVILRLLVELAERVETLEADRAVATGDWADV